MNHETTKAHIRQNVNHLTKQLASFIQILVQWLEIKEDTEAWNEHIRSGYKQDGSVIYAFNCPNPEIFKKIVADNGLTPISDIEKIIILTEEAEIENIRKIYASNYLFEVLSIKEAENMKFDTVFLFYPFRTYLNNNNKQSLFIANAQNKTEDLVSKQFYNIYKAFTCVKTNLALILSNKEWIFLTNKLNHRNTDFLKLQSTKEALERYINNKGLTKLTGKEYIEVLKNIYRAILGKMVDDNKNETTHDLFKQFFIYILKAYNTQTLNSELLDITQEYEIKNKINDTEFKQIIANFSMDEKVILNAFWAGLNKEYSEAYGLWKELGQDNLARYILDILVKQGLLLDALIATDDINKVDEEFKKIGSPLTEKEIFYLDGARAILNKNLIYSSNELLAKMLVSQLE